MPNSLEKYIKNITYIYIYKYVLNHVYKIKNNFIYYL